MEPGSALLPHLLITIALLVGGWLVRPRVLLAALPLADAALLAVYVFGEDTYRGDVSRWNAYRSPGGALGPLFIASLVFLVACAALLAYAGLRGRDGLVRSVAIACAVGGVFVIIPVIIGFGAN